MRPTTQKKERLEMSENYRWYIQKMAELRVCREIQPPSNPARGALPGRRGVRGEGRARRPSRIRLGPGERRIIFRHEGPNRADTRRRRGHLGCRLCAPFAHTSDRLEFPLDRASPR